MTQPPPDIAELLQREYAARAARDAMLSVVSHDLTNPISAIRMCVMSLLNSGHELTPETRDSLLRTILDSADWMQRLIQDLRDITNIEAGKLSLRRGEHSVARILERAAGVFRPLSEDHNISLVVECADALPLLSCDADRILQAVSNLLSNALKFSDRGSTITIRATTVADAVQLSIADQGPGLTADEVTHLFDRFWKGWQQSKTAHARGSGLGLAIAKGVVDMHNGRIWCESTPGVGSTFVLEIPMAG